MYYELLKKLAPLDRCHCGPDMELAYQMLVNHYPGAQLLRYSDKSEVNKWLRPPFWSCLIAELVDETGKVIASRSLHNLAVYTYSPVVDKTVTLKELQKHLLSDPNRPDAICFHFHNQYRHWNPEWGFSIPHKVREKLSDSINYHVKIDSEFDQNHEMTQSDYHHQGESDDTYLFVGHFDHPSQVNDGLAGCIVGYEIIRRLQGRKTRFSYRAFASVEIVGSVYYLDALGEETSNFCESLFLGVPGIDSPLVYQKSFQGNSLIDRIASFMMSFYNLEESNIYGHREFMGNDENIFDSVGYEIATGTLMRWPHPHYHTHLDSIEITKEDQLEEMISFVLGIVDVIENNYFLSANYKGTPSMSHPEIDLYLSGDSISGMNVSSSINLNKFESKIPKHELLYLERNPHLLNKFMQNIVRLSDGKHTILDIAEFSHIPFGVAFKYATLMKEKKLISFCDIEV